MYAILEIAETNQAETLDFAALDQSPEDRAACAKLRKAKAERRIAAWAVINTPMITNLTLS